jgi:hypothetical protein
VESLGSIKCFFPGLNDFVAVLDMLSHALDKIVGLIEKLRHRSVERRGPCHAKGVAVKVFVIEPIFVDRLVIGPPASSS